jgi:AcrR family transcriptional regulator
MMAKPRTAEAPEKRQPGRVERRRARVRQRILEVAEELTRSRGVGGVTIEDITESADVARRTFYHYFDSKHDVLVPIARARTRELNCRIDRVVEDVDDPADVVSIALRHTLRSLPEDPLCAWFIFSSGLPQQRLLEGIGESGRRDVSRGIETGRFTLANAAAANSLLGGAVIGALSGRLEGTLDDADLDDAVEYLLRLLGISDREARDIAHRPLPPMEPSGS